MPAATPSLRDRLTDLEQQVAEARDERATARTEAERAKAAVAASQGPMDDSNPEFAKARAAVDRAQRAQDKVEALDEECCC